MKYETIMRDLDISELAGCISFAISSMVRAELHQREEEIKQLRERVSEAITDEKRDAATIEELRTALRNLVEACFRADNDGELDSRIDGELMDAAWNALHDEDISEHDISGPGGYEDRGAR